MAYGICVRKIRYMYIGSVRDSESRRVGAGGEERQKGKGRSTAGIVKCNNYSEITASPLPGYASPRGAEPRRKIRELGSTLA